MDLRLEEFLHLEALKVKAEWFPAGEERARSLLRRVVPIIRKAIKGDKDPSVTVIARKTRSPFKVLVSTVISARTKDEVTLAASEKLFSRESTPEGIASLSERQIAKLIYPAGFYKTKARAIRELSKMIISDYGGRVPGTIDELLELPGVGRKTANLVVTQGFGRPGICVDTHVHRVVNRLGAVSTGNPGDTEFALRRVLPRRYWIEINDLLVTFGRVMCTPISPFCSQCGVYGDCARSDVKKSR